jgi:hypothetical protein
MYHQPQSYSVAGDIYCNIYIAFRKTVIKSVFKANFTKLEIGIYSAFLQCSYIIF